MILGYVRVDTADRVLSLRRHTGVSAAPGPPIKRSVPFFEKSLLFFPGTEREPRKKGIDLPIAVDIEQGFQIIFGKFP